MRAAKRGQGRERSPLVASVVLVLSAASTSSRAADEEPVPLPLTLAAEGRARAVIVLAQDAIAPEKTAARELADYLGKITGARFDVRSEARSTEEQVEIHVGPTSAARESASCDQRGPEEWVIRTVDQRLILCGGRPRGTLYAVYHLLEDHLGVRWWTPWDETVPSRADLVLGPLDVSGQPEFVYRDVFLGAFGPMPRLFAARMRLNGEFSFVDPAYGGRHAYGPDGHHVHTYYLYAPPNELREAHPEYFTDLDDEDDDRGQLCLTERGLRDHLERQLRSFIESSEREAREEGRSPPTIFELSPNDWAGGCDCPSCVPLVEREGESGALIDTVNDLSARIAADHPEVRVGALAYWNTIEPPKTVSAGPGVVVRLAELFEQDFTKPITDPANRFYRRVLHGWLERSKHLWIWEYTTTFSEGFGLPLPNLPLLATNFRYYRDHGVEGVYAQHDHVVLSDNRYLGQWVIAHLLEDPDLDPEALIEEFTSGYYGPAGTHVHAYLDRLGRALARKPSRIGYPNEIVDWRFLDRSFLIDAQAIFDRAERAVADDPVLTERVRYARMPLDRATLERWPFEFGRGRGSGPGELDPVTLAARVRETARREIDQRLGPADVYQRELVDRRLKRAMKAIGVNWKPRDRPHKAERVTRP